MFEFEKNEQFFFFEFNNYVKICKYTKNANRERMFITALETQQNTVKLVYFQLYTVKPD